MDYIRQTNTFMFEEDPISKIFQGIANNMLEAFLLMTFLQTKPHNKIKNTTYYDLYYTKFKNLTDAGGEN